MNRTLMTAGAIFAAIIMAAACGNREKASAGTTEITTEKGGETHLCAETEKCENGHRDGSSDMHSGGMHSGGMHSDAHPDKCTDGCGNDNPEAERGKGNIGVAQIRALGSQYAGYTDEELDCSNFVVLCEYIPEILQEIRYFTTYNFVGCRVDGYLEPYALGTKKMADSLRAVSRDMMAKGYRLKVFDAYRPDIAVKHFVRWAKNLGDTLTKKSFYPELDKSLLFKSGYISSRSGHSRGSTVDLTLLDIRTGKELDMGGAFDYFGELSHPAYENITPEQKANRMILREAMLRHGFRPLYSEWWHFTLKDEPYPDTYFSFPAMDIAASTDRQECLPNHNKNHNKNHDRNHSR